jgi:membrane-bound lytic murein transglycosylase D
MMRGRLLVVAVLLGGCAGSGRTALTPTVTPVTNNPPSTIAATSPTDPSHENLPAAPVISLEGAISDSAVLQRLAADSAKDAAILDRLHDSRSSAGPDTPTPADSDLGATFDINVTNYMDHERVRYWLDFFQGPARDRMSIWLTRLPRYEPMIRTALTANGLPGDLVYLGLIESGYSNTAVSRSRAVGMWQFMKGTAKDFGLRVDRWVDERRDPFKATEAAAKYLAQLTARFGSHYLAAAAYNGGPGTVARGLSRMDEPDEDEDDSLALGHSGDAMFFQLSDTRYLRRETKDYIPKLIAAAMIAKQPERYGFAPIPTVDPLQVDSVSVSDATSLEVVAKVSGVSLVDLVELNPHYLRLVTPPGQPSVIMVPKGMGSAVDSVLSGLGPSERLPVLAYTTRAGETWRSVGKRYGLTAAELMRFNPKVSPKRLPVGVTLIVPGAARIQSWKSEDAREQASARRGRSSGGTHVVERGETVGGIARRYRVSVSALREWNYLDARGTIRVGQRLVVRAPGGRTVATAAPARSAKGKGAPAKRASVSEGLAKTRAAIHIVRPGDTLSAIAKRYRVSVEALMSANGIHSTRGLKVGKRLTIPS